MRKILIMLAITFTVSTALAATGSMPKDFKLTGLTNKKTMQSLGNKTTVLQFWASWCVGCGTNMKILSDMKKKMKKTNFEYVPVSVDETNEEALSFFEDKSADVKKLKNVSYLDQGTKLATKLEIGSLPALVVVDSSGRVIKRIQGHLSAKQVGELKQALNKGK